MKCLARVVAISVMAIALGDAAQAAPIPGTAAAWVIARPLLDASLALFRFGNSAPVKPEGTKVSRDEGRRVLEFPIGRATPTLLVDVRGDVEFERADVGFPDGSVESVDAFAVRRDTGLYELAAYDTPRSVEWVRLVLRARSRQARVGLVARI